MAIDVYDLQISQERKVDHLYDEHGKPDSVQLGPIFLKLTLEMSYGSSKEEKDLVKRLLDVVQEIKQSGKSALKGKKDGGESDVG